MKNKKSLHLIYIPFTGVGLYGGYRGDEWFKERIRIFKEYTLKSLLNQTNKDFIVWMSFRPEEINNPLLEELGKILISSPLIFLCTFDGLMYHDDKFTKECYSRLLNYGRIVRECVRNRTTQGVFRMCKEVFKNKNSTLEKRLLNSLELIQDNFPFASLVYLTRLDSDDMLKNTMVKDIQSIPPFQGALVCKNGYIYNETTKELAEYVPHMNPPFHTIIFPANKFFNAKKHLAYYKDFKSHEDIPRIFNTKQLSNGSYCVFTHNPKYHISTVWNHPFKRGIITNKSKKSKILRSFGI